MNQAFIIQNHILLGVPKALCVKKENSRSWGWQPCQSSWGRGSINATWVEYYQLFCAIKLEESKFQVKHWMDPQLIPYGWGLFTEKDEVSPLCISSPSTKSEVEKNFSRWSWWSRRRRRRPRRRRYKLEKLTHISSIQYLSWQRALTVHYWSIQRWDESEWPPKKYGLQSVPKKSDEQIAGGAMVHQ